MLLFSAFISSCSRSIFSREEEGLRPSEREGVMSTSIWSVIVVRGKACTGGLGESIVNGGGAFTPSRSGAKDFPPFTRTPPIHTFWRVGKRVPRRKVTLPGARFTLPFTLFWRGRLILSLLSLNNISRWPFIFYTSPRVPCAFSCILSLDIFLLNERKWPPRECLLRLLRLLPVGGK
jgi:hypothetical protein